MSKILNREDLQQVNTPDSVVSLFGKLGYDTHCQPIDVEDLELSPKSAEAVIEAYFIANQTDANLQVLLFQLSPHCWTSDSAAFICMSAIANSLCKRPSHFFLLATLDYRQLLLVSPQKTLDEQMELKLSIAKTPISLRDPSFYEIQLLEKIAAQSLTPRSLYHLQHQTLSLARQEKRKFRDDPVRDYLQRIGRVKLLTAEQEILLSRKVQHYLKLKAKKRELRKKLKREPQDAEWAIATGITLSTLYEDLAIGHLARNKLTEANLRLVVSIAKQYQGRGLELLELIQEGNFGLMRAVEKFDSTKGNKFSTYATWWIKQSVTRAVYNHSRLIRVPIHRWDKYNKVKKERKLLIQAGKINPSLQVIAQQSGMALEDIRELLEIFQSPVSLDKLVGDSQDTRLEEMVLSDSTNKNSLDKMALSDYVAKILSNLTEKEKKVIILRFGLDGNKARSLQSVGDEIGGVSRERIRQIENKALKKIRAIAEIYEQKNPPSTNEFDNPKKIKDYKSTEKTEKNLSPPLLVKPPEKAKNQSSDVVVSLFYQAKRISDVQERFEFLNKNRKISPKDDRGLKKEIFNILKARVYKTIAQVVYIIWGISRPQDPELYEFAKEELLRLFDYQFPQY